jgi:hypothetical protein
MSVQVKLRNNVPTWNAKRRYKVNDVVVLDGRVYQNKTGSNSSPDLLTDFEMIKDSLTGTFSSYQNTFPYVDTNDFTVPVNLVVVSVLYNDIDTVSFTQSGTTLSYVGDLFDGDVIKVRGVLV